jgi:hypothetical protein
LSDVTHTHTETEREREREREIKWRGETFSCGIEVVMVLTRHVIPYLCDTIQLTQFIERSVHKTREGDVQA